MALPFLSKKGSNARAALVVLGLFLVGPARAEEPSVPISLQAKLLAKLTAYDRNMKTRAGDRIRVALLVKPKDADSVRVGGEMQHALGDIADFAGVAHEELSVPYTSAAELAKASVSLRISIVYVAPGFDEDLAAIAQSLRGLDVLTVSSVADYVPRGIVVGFDAVGGQTQLLVNLTQANAQHVAFTADVLKLMKVYR